MRKVDFSAEKCMIISNIQGAHAACARNGGFFMKKTLLKNYAKLIARVGANIQKGQRVVITAQLDQPQFVCMLAE